MTLTIPIVKKEIKELKEQRSEIERKIEALERFLPPQESNASGSAMSARGGVDIRPAITEIFTANGNETMKLKDVISAVSARHSEVPKEIVVKKMAHAKRTILEQTEYGRYRLKGGVPSAPSG